MCTKDLNALWDKSLGKYANNLLLAYTSSEPRAILKI